MVEKKHLHDSVYVCPSQAPAAVCSSYELCAKEGASTQQKRKKNCITERITADKEERGRSTERVRMRAKKQRRDKKTASVSSGFVLWVFIFQSMLRRRKCNIQW